jgi:hypothetical protein
MIVQSRGPSATMPRLSLSQAARPDSPRRVTRARPVVLQEGVVLSHPWGVFTPDGQTWRVSPADPCGSATRLAAALLRDDER